jgi:hypothetical protein
MDTHGATATRRKRSSKGTRHHQESAEAGGCGGDAAYSVGVDFQQAGKA